MFLGSVWLPGLFHDLTDVFIEKHSLGFDTKVVQQDNAIEFRSWGGKTVRAPAMAYPPDELSQSNKFEIILYRHACVTKLS
jgi:hypothetical protein